MQDCQWAPCPLFLTSATLTHRFQPEIPRHCIRLRIMIGIISIESLPFKFDTLPVFVDGKSL